MEKLQVGRAKLTWLSGGVNFLDGGAMFGVVPKALWSKKYPHNEKNQIELRTDPILLQIDNKNYLIDTGMGNNKLNEKLLRNFGVLEESYLESSLANLGLTVDDIDAVLMTHLHFDHACGLTRPEGDTYESVFKNATIYTSAVEWNEMKNPNIRSVNTYWKMNWEPIVDQVETFDTELEITEGLKMVHTGGHSDGHCILTFTDGEEHFIHMADLMPTHAHQNKLWALAYDDYPVTSVHEKEKWMNKGYKKEAWYTFYHDAYFRAIKFNQEGNKVDEVARERYEYK
ncbi:YtnP family quorum-quenching lactonase [Virgibacillus halodenitrificans]|uniref:YtnP family quorum-quenching lactonase n=1 Tax=Virgibacillus halodenitrificans TaxID=1482 RepID=UPI00045CCE7A|nr:MBL fold metallo-hydrolase [Virgibacillus halodenitrificans]MCG1027747.1 MBL fold metallo-hydrolase [Virgibacillus halodenitrificans]WHX27794.1 MBL fold metallo-hydrolase [Virgibacillus halodenitrificans]CDQ37044.1 putative metal-dependent RNase, consists of a metallo-beta-lactamase domain and an RNA-binding KH domain [Virgibacillus halodenitrificans]